MLPDTNDISVLETLWWLMKPLTSSHKVGVAANISSFSWGKQWWAIMDILTNKASLSISPYDIFCCMALHITDSMRVIYMFRRATYHAGRIFNHECTMRDLLTRKNSDFLLGASSLQIEQIEHSHTLTLGNVAMPKNFRIRFLCLISCFFTLDTCTL